MKVSIPVPSSTTSGTGILPYGALHRVVTRSVQGLLEGLNEDANTTTPVGMA
jgi:hypothetical protein